MSGELCDAAIRPFAPVNTFEVRCDLTGEHTHHEGVILDYAYPGSSTKVGWLEGDRRTFRGQWPGSCYKMHLCILPKDHHGKCAT